jgi:hypothetical protein
MTRHSVAVYTGHSQFEQPHDINNVTAVAFVDGLLSIEYSVTEGGLTFSAFHRFEPGHWTRFTVAAL